MTDYTEISQRVHKAGNEAFSPDHFMLACMSVKSRMQWALNNGVISQDEFDIAKEANKANDYHRWEYAE